MNSRRLLATFGVLLLLVFFLALQWRRLPIHRFQALFGTPIDFYGQVVDQLGDEVPGAVVEARANAHPNGPPAVRNLIADAHGKFEIHGLHGIQLAVSVSKRGYSRVQNEPRKMGSAGGFDYVAGGGAPGFVPVAGQPIVFTLYRHRGAEPLLGLKSIRVGLPDQPTPVWVSADASDRRERVFEVRAWGDPEHRTSTGVYAWRAEIRPRSGAIAPRNGNEDYEAPESGYAETAAIEMPDTLARPSWNDVMKRSYFVRFSDGTFARVVVTIAAPPHGSVSITGVLNPKTGSRLLEPDIEPQ